MDQAEALSIIHEALFAYSLRRFDQITDDSRFAYYTSADTAMQIIKGDSGTRSLWMRQAAEMNDFQEVEFGQMSLKRALSDQKFNERFKAAFALINDELLRPVIETLDAEWSDLKLNTFLLCLALHKGIELEMGKLSMWRAYGGKSNVCLLFNTTAFRNDQDAYDVSMSPVFYGGAEGFKAELSALLDRLERHREKLKTVPLHILALNLKRVIEFAILSTKHPAFWEEAEWRLIYKPTAEGPNLPRKIVSVEGIVQPVFMLPMENVKVEGGNSVEHATLDELLFRIIIGPTPNPVLVANGFETLLAEAGVTNPHDRIWISGIPLRR